MVEDYRVAVATSEIQDYKGGFTRDAGRTYCRVVEECSKVLFTPYLLLLTN